MNVKDLFKRSPIPTDWKVTTEWMNKAIQRHHPGTHVSSVDLVYRSDGTSSRARFALTYSQGEGPKTVFAKSKGNWLRRFLHAMTGNAFIEGRLYESKVALNIEHPTFYYGAVDQWRLNDLIVMEDVSERGAVLNDATTPLSFDAVANGLRELAGLHSRFWNYDHKSHPQLSWVNPWKASPTFQFLLKYGCKRGTSRLLDYIPDPIIAQGPNMMVDAWTDYLGSVNEGPTTLLHGDAHVGNTYLLPDGTLGFYDWGVVRRGHWSFDVGYFIISALSEEDRRTHAKDLIAIYLDALDLPEADRPDSEEAWWRFRCSPAYGLAIWVTTGAEDNYQLPVICQNLSKRFGSAFLELDTRAALDERYSR
ncbi:phosphotransferase [Ketobacter sp.]|nr:MAG: aminoglycoside phosphotransferase [Ketobacter sp.]